MIWKRIKQIKEFIKKCRRDKINAYSAQTAFFIVLSLIPFLMLFSSLLQFTPITESMLMTIYQRALPDYVSTFLISITDEVYHRSGGVISATALAAVWSAARGIHYMTDGLNSVHGLEENRNWFVLRFWAVIYTVLFLVAIVITLVVLVFGNTLHRVAVNYIPILQAVTGVFERFGGVVMLVLLTVFFIVIFTVLPNKKIHWKAQVPGAMLCSISWNVFSFFLSVYVDYFHGFSVYGSLTTIVLIMLWIYFCVYILMLGVEINVFLETKRMCNG